MRVPVVDLAALTEEQAAQVIRDACLESGFFIVTNHGVPEELVAQHFEEQRKFFALPLEKKMETLVDKRNRGYTPMFNTTLHPEASKAADSHEGLYFGREVPADSPEAQLPLHGPNQWPSEELLPGYRGVVERYFEATRSLGMRLLGLLALSLGLHRDFFQPCFTRPILSLRPLHYSGRQSDPEAGVFGAGAHTDWGMLTLLRTTEPGLQICPDRDSGAWVDVPLVEGAFVVNQGDMLERWTNGLYRSTLHRVVNTSGRERFSCALFMEPNFEQLVEPLPQCCQGRPAKYPPTTCGEHLMERFRATHARFAAAQTS